MLLRVCCQCVSTDVGRAILLIRLEESNGRNATELLTALEEGNLEDEEIADQLTSELLHQGASGRGRSTCE